MLTTHTRGQRFLVGALTTLVTIGFFSCGGNATKTEDGEENGGAGGNPPAAGAGGVAGSENGGAGNFSTGGAPGDCTMVPEYLSNLQEAAAACSPADPSLHCQDIVDGFCCPVVVESANSPATLAYLDFLELTKTQCPEMWERCALVDCAFPTPGNCVPDAIGSGHCESDF